MTATNAKKLTVGVIFGGRSVEHDVSVVTGQQVIRALNPSRYEVVPLYITRTGVWLTGAPLTDIKTFQNANVAELMGVNETTLSSGTNPQGTITPPFAGYLKRSTLKKIDVLFPTIHGTHGEDGTLQGLFELADIPYVGCGVMASAVANDKITTKAVLKEHGIPVLPYVGLSRPQWRTNREAVLDVLNGIGYPLFVKPATLGSSIGIGRPEDRAAAAAALDVAFGLDRRVVVEQALEGAIEVNCALLGNDDPRPSVLEQPISFQEFLSYEDKYLRGGAGKGMKGAERHIPAPISEELTARIKDMAVAAFRAIDGRGTARIDFLVQAGEVYLNEVNTMPGSLAFYLWQAEGMSPPALCDALIQLALEAHAEKRRTIYDYRSPLLNQAALKGVKGLGGYKK
ncbi:MAG TPA: D-alanine--D-alanine ligase family protein [Aggregatilineales bacterium]|nr:D-alanine--D-alanine ligase [Anaerolineales bacterium]HRE49750.1 D-alanine--D-alanine ligase family protein [Aggregatilineales bacterium]